MKKITNYLMLFVVSGLLFSSCSREEEMMPRDGNKAKVSFGTLLNDMVANSGMKQAMDIPECSENAPAFVEVVLSGPNNVGTLANPLVVNINSTPGDYDGDGEAEYFTEESVDLELDPGTYTLEFFAVYDGDPALPGSNRIWIAPMAGGNLANFVDVSLPMDFNLGAGVKKYIDVEVLCFDDRMVNDYGYLFFDVDGVRAYEFCFFANYCTPDGRHYPASYSVNIWMGTDNTGTLLYSKTNHTGIGNEDDPYNSDEPFAEPSCFALPNPAQIADDKDYLYYEVTLLEWDGVYEYVETEPLSGTLNRNGIVGNFGPNNTIDFEHLRFGCESPVDPCPEGTVDTDEDGILDECDPCPLVPYWLDNDGDCLPNNQDPCPNDATNNCETEEPCDDEETECDGTETAWMWGDYTLTKKDNDGLSLSGKWGWAEEFVVGQSDTSFNFHAGAGNNNTSNGFLAGEVQVSVSGTTVTITVAATSGVNLNKLDIYVNDAMPETASPGQFKFYGGLTDEDPCSSTSNTYSFEHSGDGTFWIMVHGEACQS